MSVDMSAHAITQRLRSASQSSDLRSELRLTGKIDMSPGGVVRRLREVEQLRRACLALGRLRRVPDPAP